MAVKLYYKEDTDGAVTTPIPLDSLLAVKESVSSGNNVPEEHNTNIREINRDISNLFQLLDYPEEMNRYYVPASYAEPTHIFVDYKGSKRDLADIFGLLDPAQITDPDQKELALRELQAANADVYGDWVRIPAGLGGTITIASPRLPFYNMEFAALLWGTPTIYEGSGQQELARTLTFQNKEGERVSALRFDVDSFAVGMSYRVEVKPIAWL